MKDIQLLKNNKQVYSIFSLLGAKENALTFSLAWICKSNQIFLKRLLKLITQKNIKLNVIDINIQRYDDKHGGYTDIELSINNSLLIIIEAKKRLSVPTQRQIKQYLNRVKRYPKMKHAFVVISDCPREYVIRRTSNYNIKTKIIPISWEEIYSIIPTIRDKSNDHQKILLKEFDNFLKDIIIMQNKESNKVFCVALSRKLAGNGKAKITFLDIVTKRKKYFYPVGKGWPSPPPNYIAFRIGGKLLSIHYIKSFKIVTNLHKYIKEIPKYEYDPLYLLELDKPFFPDNVVNGKIFANGHIWFMLDTIFTSKSIKEARDKTKKRVSP